MKRTLTFAAAIALLATFGVLGHLRASAPSVPSQTWSASGAMAAARAGASATLLPGGSVLVAGGLSDAGAVASVEQFSPSADAFFAMPPLQQARANHSATLLQDGRVLVAGGVGADGHAIASAEIYDANTNAWQPAGALAVARAGHTATLLPDGRVLVAGGDDGGVPNAVLELFDPAVGAFAPLDATLTAARTGHAAALAGGKVLIVGGFDGEHALASMDLFDPATNAVAAGAPLAQARAGHSATTLLDGKVLVAGGASDAAELASAEIYDPAANAFAPAGSALISARQHHLALLLPHSNTVLIVGGSAGGAAVAVAELYVPWEGTGGSFVATGVPSAARVWAAGSALSVPAGDTIRSGPADGLVLVAGGSPAAGATTPLASAELYGFATIKTDKSDYAPGTTVTITGDGWQPEEWVTLLLKESPAFDEHALVAVQADGNGHIVSTEFSPDDHDVDIRFYLTAIGQYSQAQTTFTDAKTQAVTVGAPTNVTVVAGATATYGTVSVNVNGNNGMCTVTLGVSAVGGTGLPAGAAPVFGTSPTTTNADFTSSFSVTTTASGLNATPAGTYTFRVTASDGVGCQDSDTASTSLLTLVVTAPLTRTLAISGAGAGVGTIASTPAGINCTSTGGTTSGTCSASFVNGATVTLTATPSAALPTTAGSTFDSWSGDGTGTTTRSVTMSATRSVTASFKANQAIAFAALAPKTFGDAAFTVSAAGGGSGNAVTFASTTATVCTTTGTNGATVTIVAAGSCSITASQAGNSNYNAAPDVSRSFTISPATLSASIVGNPTKPYDGNANATLVSANFSLSGLVGADSFTINQISGTYNSANVATATTVTANLTAGDFTANGSTVTGNYVLPATASGPGHITARLATWTTNAASKIYGDADATPLTTGSGSGFLAADNVTATYSRTSGETVLGGPYHISASLAPAAALTNYTITNTGASFSITPRPATWTTNPATKVYGDVDSAALTTGSGSGFLPGDNVTATYTRTAGETVVGGPYSITATLAPTTALMNYTITNTGASFSITPRPATWTTNPATKVYGDVDPAPLTTGSGSGFLPGDNVTATYTRTAGETVVGGPYSITATLAPTTALTNYTITNAGANFTITPRPATWTTNAAGKVYGDVDPDPLATGSGSGFLTADNVTATYTRAAGETVLGGPYHITATLTPIAVLTNYSITNAGASFAITPRPATWTTNAGSKVYGDGDPAPLTTGSGSGFLPADNVTATYTRAAGETVLGGPYHITATLTPTAVLTNYSITNAGASFAITPRPATWTTNAASKTYGDPDPSPLTTGSGSGFITADGVTATYARVSGETVLGGPYHITATLTAAVTGALSNYVITNAGAAFTINLRPATWTTNAASKTYGDPDPSPLTTGSGSGFITADGVTATYARVSGQTVLGGPYHITATLTAAVTGALSNYVITNAGAAFTIDVRPATWTTNAASKTYGDPDPSPLTTGSGSGFVTADGVTATYARVSGETVLGGPYHITATLSPAAVLSNYVITNNGASFTISARPLAITANNRSKTLGETVTFTGIEFTSVGLAAGDTIASVSLTSAGAPAAALVGTYPIVPSAAVFGVGLASNYVITYHNGTLTIGYAVCVLYDQGKSVQRNATVPIKLYLCNSTGGDVSSASTVVTATALALVSTSAPAVLDDSGNANPDNNFRFDSTLGPSGGYIFNLSTKPLGSGTFGLTFIASGDPTTHTVTFGVK